MHDVLFRKIGDAALKQRGGHEGVVRIVLDADFRFEHPDAIERRAMEAYRKKALPGLTIRLPSFLERADTTIAEQINLQRILIEVPAITVPLDVPFE